MTEAVKLVDNDAEEVVTEAVKLVDNDAEEAQAEQASEAVGGAGRKIEDPRGGPEREYECELCLFTAGREAIFRSHMARMHTTMEQLDGCTDNETEMEFDLERERARRQSRWIRSEPRNPYANWVSRNKY